ncbi:MAG: DUF4184 family protein [Candidatus Bathyarchaeota archaeon]|nr:MAG: DUF4184 family protein [Candidatus Bathyarchaeota archaeon]
MPTPLGHFTIAYIIYTSKKSLSLPALIVGSIIPDIDVFFHYMTRGYVGRELLHSFIGAGVLGTLMSTLLVVLFYPLVTSTFFRLRKEEVRRACKLSKNVLASSFIGGLSHILIDSTCHNYNPLFYPFTKQSIDVLLFTPDWEFSYVVIELFLVMLLVMLVFGVLRKGVQGFFKRILVGE